ncbi:hypothetical protein OAJ44_00190 [Chloroflexi bacterium]|nr:hypothetical protein [Chloroflexota bacterium]
MTNNQENPDFEEPKNNDLDSDGESHETVDNEPIEESKMSNDALQVESIPEGSIIFKQSHLSWLMPSSIWIIALVIVDLQIGLLGGLGILLAPLIAGPRFLRWKQTVYHLSEDSLYLTMAGLPIIQKSKIYRVKFDTIASDENGKALISIRHGIFGKTLGYGEVNITFDDKRIARLSYISEYQSFIDYINERR